MVEVTGCIIIENNSILLLHKINPSRYELPGGKVEKGETAHEAAKREAHEELLCEVVILKKFNDITFEEDGQTIHYTRFLAKIKKGQHPQIGEKEKFDGIRFASVQELGSMQLSPNVEILYKELGTSTFYTE